VAVLAAVHLAGICAAATSEQLSKQDAAFFHLHTPPTQGCRIKAVHSTNSSQKQQYRAPIQQL
jgi:hypothetical protein